MFIIRLHDFFHSKSAKLLDWSTPYFRSLSNRASFFMTLSFCSSWKVLTRTEPMRRLFIAVELPVL